MPDHTPALMASINGIIEQLRHKPGALLPMLHGIQDELGYIPKEAIPTLAAALNQTRAEISGVISFYHHFRTQPPGNHVIQVCRAEACQALGSRQLESRIKQQLGIDYHQTTADQRFTLEPVYCLGNCACGPSLRIGDDIVGRVSEQRFAQLIDELSVDTLEIIA